MHILYFGKVSLDESEDITTNPTLLSPAGQNFQSNILHELRLAGCRVTLISLQISPKLPKGSILVRGSKLASQGILDFKAPFLNLKILRVVSGTLSSLLVAFKVIRKNGSPDFLMFYNLSPQYSLPPMIISAITGIPSVGIFADYRPPADWPRAEKNLKNLLMDKVKRQIMRRVDTAIALSSTFRELTRVPTLIVEGGIFDRMESNALEKKQYMEKRPEQEQDNIYIAYTGRLDKWRGIELLLDAIELMSHPKVKLLVTGHGPLYGKVEKRAMDSTRIEFLGFVSKTQYRQVLSQATICVVPQRTAYEFSRFCFPSKLLEYMASGKLVVTTDIGDVKKLYGEHIFVLEKSDETPEGLAQLLDYILLTDNVNLIQRAKDTQSYVIREKNWKRQTTRIINFLVSFKSIGTGFQSKG